MPSARPLKLGQSGVRTIKLGQNPVRTLPADLQKVSSRLGGAVGVGTRPPFVASKHTQSSILPDRSTFVFLIVVLHLGVLCYWCYLMYLSHRRAKAAAAARGEPRTPPPRVNCTYDWAGEDDAEQAKKGFFSRFRIPAMKPFLEKKNSGRPIQRHELSAIGISNTSLPSRPRIVRTPTLPSTPELV